MIDKFGIISGSIPVLVAFKLFLRKKILTPSDIDLIVFAKSKGIELKKSDGVPEYQVVRKTEAMV